MRNMCTLPIPCSRYSNVLLGAGGRALVADAGLSILLGGPAPMYALAQPPGEHGTLAGDMWSFGALLAGLLAPECPQVRRPRAAWLPALADTRDRCGSRLARCSPLPTRWQGGCGRKSQAGRLTTHAPLRCPSWPAQHAPALLLPPPAPPQLQAVASLIHACCTCDPEHRPTAAAALQCLREAAQTSDA